ALRARRARNDTGRGSMGSTGGNWLVDFTTSRWTGPSLDCNVLLRSGYRIRENRLNEGACPECGEPIDGVWFPSA
ncbi:hypothetical protein KJ567_00400, partial [Candidatus Bipolaricaulota bacterium]|nr:hypothetical protein [Candidatus Bipolaricaulota bacterium]